METINIINCHTHIFNRRVVPENFLPKWLMPLAKLLEGKGSSKFLFNLFGKLRKHDIAMLVKKFHAFLNIGDLKSQLEIFKCLQSFYPAGTRFCVLPMDMEFMGAGKVSQSYIEQLDELAKIKQDPAYSELIYPFIFIHPERRGLLGIVRKYIEEKGFSGLKMYPPLGYYPFDGRLNEVYTYAERFQIPITSHCSRGGVFFRGDISGNMLNHPKTDQRLKDQKNKYFTDFYTDPDNYHYLLEQFPNLKINLAHFGGFDEWDKYLGNTMDEGESTWYEKVVSILKKYPNTYSDISYTMFNPDLFNLLKLTLQDHALKSKILFGSDFYMVEQETSERQFLINIRAHIGEDSFKLIAQTNPQQFLSKLL